MVDRKVDQLPGSCCGPGRAHLESRLEGWTLDLPLGNHVRRLRREEDRWHRGAVVYDATEEGSRSSVAPGADEHQVDDGSRPAAPWPTS